mmetsp:Transcript_52009/g.149939  ORF Transcript_52009/g.149939 Transcript_52009/m.149939 type:complete len:156 (-) Transcript_52009:400-867(-)
MILRMLALFHSKHVNLFGIQVDVKIKSIDAPMTSAPTHERLLTHMVRLVGRSRIKEIHESIDFIFFDLSDALGGADLLSMRQRNHLLTLKDYKWIALCAGGYSRLPGLMRCRRSHLIRGSAHNLVAEIRLAPHEVLVDVSPLVWPMVNLTPSIDV